MKQIQQGDVNITKIEKIPVDAKIKPDRILRDGEVTGHAHRLKGEAELLELGDRLFMRVLGGDVSVIHEEHNTVLIPPGEYEVTPTHEYDHFLEESRAVVD